MVGFCSIALIMTTPGQTIGVSTFTDHIIDGLEITRSNLSTAYLIGTMAAAVFAPLVGRLVDRHGVRRTMAVIGVFFGAAVIGIGAVQGIVMLTVGFFGIRLLGQGSLSLTANTGIALWFDARRGRAVAVAMSISQAVMATAPLAITGLIALVGWRFGFVVAGLVVLAVVPPMAWFLVVDRPSDLGQVADGPAPNIDAEVGLAPGTVTRSAVSLTVAQAVRSRTFWFLTIFLAIDSAVFTGIVFHNVSIMKENGLNDTEAAAIFIPFFVTTLLATFIFGDLTDKVTHRALIPVVGIFMGLTYALVTAVTPGVMMIVYSLTLGLSAGSSRALSGALYPKFFGVAHIGSIRGVAFLVSGAASGLGPLIVSLGHDATGSYAPTLQVSAVVAVVAGFVAATISVPHAQDLQA